MARLSCSRAAPYAADARSGARARSAASRAAAAPRAASDMAASAGGRGGDGREGVVGSGVGGGGRVGWTSRGAAVGAARESAVGATRESEAESGAVRGFAICQATAITAARARAAPVTSKDRGIPERCGAARGSVVRVVGPDGAGARGGAVPATPDPGTTAFCLNVGLRV